MPVPGYLRQGLNVLAVQVHNVTINSSDFVFIPELSGAFALQP